MILFTRRLMPAELRLQSDRGTQKSEIYFTNHTLTGKRTLFRCCIRTLSGDSTVRDVRNGLVRTVLVRLYFTNHTLTGKPDAFPFQESESGLGAQVGPLVKLHFARCLPYLFHQPHRSEERRVGKECRSRWSP